MTGNVVSNVKKYYGGQVPVPGQGDSDGKLKMLVEKTATIEIGGVQTEVELLYDADDLTTPVTPQQLGQWTDENYLIVFKTKDADGKVRGFILYALETTSTSTDTLVNNATFVAFKGLVMDPGASAFVFTMVEDSSTLSRYLQDEHGELTVKFNLSSVEDGAQSGPLSELISTDSPYMDFEIVRNDDNNVYLNLNSDRLDEEIEGIEERLDTIEGILDELPSDEHGYFNSSLYTTPGDGTTTNLVMGDFRISEGRDVHGENIEFVPTHQEGGIDFGEVYLNPGTYILAIQYTLQWVGNPRGTFLPKVCSVADQPFDFSYEHEDVIRVTRIVTKTTRGKLVTNIPIDADTPPMGVWVKNMEVVQVATFNHSAVVHDTTLTGKGQLGDPLGVTPAAFGKVKDIPTSISQFRNGDVIPVDGPNGPAKMSKAALLEETAQNALAGNVAPAFVPNSTTTVVGQPYIYGGLLYVAKEAYQGAWNSSKFEIISLSDVIASLKSVDEGLQKTLDIVVRDVIRFKNATQIQLATVQTDWGITTGGSANNLSGFDLYVFNVENVNKIFVSGNNPTGGYCFVSFFNNIGGFVGYYNPDNVAGWKENVEVDVPSGAYIAKVCDYRSDAEKPSCFGGNSCELLTTQTDKAVNSSGVIVTLGGGYDLDVYDVAGLDNIVISGYKPPEGYCVGGFFNSSALIVETFDIAGVTGGYYKDLTVEVPQDATTFRICKYRYTSYLTSCFVGVNPFVDVYTRNKIDEKSKKDLQVVGLGKFQFVGFKQGTHGGSEDTRLSKEFVVNKTGSLKIETFASGIDFILQKWDGTQYVSVGTWYSPSHTYEVAPGNYNIVLKKSNSSVIRPTDDVQIWFTDCGVDADFTALESRVDHAEDMAQAALDATTTMLGNYDIICAASDTPQTLKQYAKYICDSADARPTLQEAINEATDKSVKVVLLPGTYIVDSRAEVDGTPISAGLIFKNDKPDASIYIKYNNAFNVLEGVCPPIGYDSVANIKMGSNLYADIGNSEAFSLLASNEGDIRGRGLKVRNLSLSIPDNAKPICIVDGSTSFLIHFENLFVAGCNMQDYTFADNTGTFPSVANAGCVGIRGVAGSNWGVQNIINNCEVSSCGTGFELGGEHGFFTNLSAKYNTYGFTFSHYKGKDSVGGSDFGAMGYPLICINLLDEHNANLPKFYKNVSTSSSQAITIENYNIQWPNTCPGHTNRNASNFLTGRTKATEDQPGWWYGRIDYMVDNVMDNTRASMISFFEEGHGVNVVCTHQHMKTIGDSATRLSYQPNLGQKYYDTDLKKMLIFDGTNWVDMDGTIVTSLWPSSLETV